MRGSRFEKRALHTARKDRAVDYGSLKRAWSVTVATHARRAGLPRAAALWTWPVVLGFYWYEPNRHRDPDGVDGGGRKLILDALATCTDRCRRSSCAEHAGVLPTDGAAHVQRFRAPEFRYLGADVAGCSVGFFSWRNDREMLAPPLVLPFVLPDLNELQAARELGARRDLARQNYDR